MLPHETVPATISFSLCCLFVDVSLITVVIPSDGENKDVKGIGGVDLKTLRAIRVLRPLKLVSGVPSKYWLSLHLFSM